jgi:hypothetical protein
MAAGLLIAASATARADSKSIMIEQVTSTAAAVISEAGVRPVDGSAAGIVQRGDGNVAEITQDAIAGEVAHFGVQYQLGDGNQASLVQGAIDRRGEAGPGMNTAVQVQIGNGNTAYLEQYGSNNAALQYQQGDGNLIARGTQVQDGHGLGLAMIQIGNGLVAPTVIQEGPGTGAPTVIVQTSN